jgi:carboxypeptidase Taq
LTQSLLANSRTTISTVANVHIEILTNKATVVWSEAKQKNNFNLFKPYLEKIYDKNRKLADLLGYNESPYDALLDLYEEELTSKEVSNFFNEVLTPLKSLLNKIVSSPNYKKTHFLETKKYDKNKMIALNEKVLKDLWPEYGKEGNFRLDVSSHPFTISFNNQDTRITTWYNDTDFARSLMATVHEFGHALYDMQYANELNMTPIAGGSSLVIHESQSRFWENHIGRSKEFIKNLYETSFSAETYTFIAETAKKLKLYKEKTCYFIKI